MDFRFTEDQLSIQSVARDFAQKRIAPIAADFDKSGEFPLETIREMGALGLMGIEVPHEYGGAGLDPISYVLAMIEIAAADCAHSTIMSVNNTLYCNGILKNGNEEQKQKYVRAVAEGHAIGAYALTEPQSGSDASNMHTRAAKNADGDWVINGKKSWITSGPVARYIVLFAITSPGKGAKGVTALIIDRSRHGTTPARPSRNSASAPGDPRDRTQRVRLPGRRHARRGGRGPHRHVRLDAGRISIASQAAGARGVRSQRQLRANARRLSSDRLLQMTQAKLADMNGSSMRRRC
jgi:alkylation response protein AidB-like acyl-CoA dehydrogenase